MPPPPRRSSNLYLPSKTWPIRRSTGASTKVSSARNGIKSSGHTCVLSANRRPHLGHESIIRFRRPSLLSRIGRDLALSTAVTSLVESLTDRQTVSTCYLLVGGTSP